MKREPGVLVMGARALATVTLAEGYWRLAGLSVPVLAWPGTDPVAHGQEFQGSDRALAMLADADSLALVIDLGAEGQQDPTEAISRLQTLASNHWPQTTAWLLLPATEASTGILARAAATLAGLWLGPAKHVLSRIVLVSTDDGDPWQEAVAWHLLATLALGAREMVPSFNRGEAGPAILAIGLCSLPDAPRQAWERLAAAFPMLSPGVAGTFEAPPPEADLRLQASDLVWQARAEHAQPASLAQAIMRLPAQIRSLMDSQAVPFGAPGPPEPLGLEACEASLGQALAASRMALERLEPRLVASWLAVDGRSSAILAAIRGGWLRRHRVPEAWKSYSEAIQQAVSAEAEHAWLSDRIAYLEGQDRLLATVRRDVATLILGLAGLGSGRGICLDLGQDDLDEAPLVTLLQHPEATGDQQAKWREALGPGSRILAHGALPPDEPRLLLELGVRRPEDIRALANLPAPQGDDPGKHGAVRVDAIRVVGEE